MDSSDDGSVSQWLDGLRDGDSLAATELWNRYFAQLVVVARARLAKMPGVSSEEDVALSAMKSVMLGVREGRFPDLSDREGLWPLLVTIAARKSASVQRRRLAQKRSANRECSYDELRTLLGAEASPEFATEVADELTRLMTVLADDTLCRVVELKLSGYTNEEIADQLGCHKRTVIRKLARVREEWLAEEEGPQGAD